MKTYSPLACSTANLMIDKINASNNQMVFAGILLNDKRCIVSILEQSLVYSPMDTVERDCLISEIICLLENEFTLTLPSLHSIISAV